MTMTAFTEMLKFQLLVEVVIVIVTSHCPPSYVLCPPSIVFRLI